jgi:hypothetical protein
MLNDPNGSTAPNGFPLGDLTGPEKVQILGQAVGTWPPQENVDFAGHPALTPDTGLVTLDWGGNEVGFGETLITCIITPACPIIGSILDSEILQIMPILVQAYEEIARLAPKATIIVMGYPRWFPTVPPPSYDTFTLLQMLWINSEIQKLDNAIAAAVASAQKANVNIRYVTGSYDAFTGHELSTASPDLNGLVLSNLAYSFHPNLPGNERMAQLAVQAYQGH